MKKKEAHIHRPTKQRLCDMKKKKYDNYLSCLGQTKVWYVCMIDHKCNEHTNDCQEHKIKQYVIICNIYSQMHMHWMCAHALACSLFVAI